MKDIPYSKKIINQSLEDIDYISNNLKEKYENYMRKMAKRVAFNMDCYALNLFNENHVLQTYEQYVQAKWEARKVERLKSKLEKELDTKTTTKKVKI